MPSMSIVFEIMLWCPLEGGVVQPHSEKLEALRRWENPLASEITLLKNERLKRQSRIARDRVLKGVIEIRWD